ncbi:hypothetical protein HDU96_006605 [Phlyctochytrium bullatum]|nr:hypothetical protein HDU96_006605 [Phlyctochytrium bullatum]
MSAEEEKAYLGASSGSSAATTSSTAITIPTMDESAATGGDQPQEYPPTNIAPTELLTPSKDSTVQPFQFLTARTANHEEIATTREPFKTVKSEKRKWACLVTAALMAIVTIGTVIVILAVLLAKKSAHEVGVCPSNFN